MSNTQHSNSRLITIRRLAVVFILLVHITLLSISSFLDSPTNVETAHLPAGLSHWEHGTFYYFKQNPPLVRLVASIPVLFVPHQTNWTSYSDDKRVRCELGLGTDFLEANQERIRLLYGLARLACIPFSVVGALICFFWSKELFGYASGLIAMILWCFSPTILGHGHLLNPDVPAAAMGIAAAYTFRNWLNSQTFYNAIITGIVCGLCITTKSTWVFLLILLPIIYVIAFLLRFQRKQNLYSQTKFVQLGILLLSAVFIVNLVYGFEGSFRLLKSYQFVSKTLSGNEPLPSGNLKLGNRFENSLLGYIPVPFPNYFVDGLDVQKSDFERPWDSYLNGVWKKGGWRNYYFYGMLYKTPETTLLLFVAAILLSLFCAKNRLPLYEDITLIIPCIFIVGLCSLQSNMSVHYRYIIPALPFIYIFISGVGTVFQHKTLSVKIIVSSLCCGSVFICMTHYPHCISYFNFLSGGSQNGYKRMQASSLDWGQDLYRLKDWQTKHCGSEPCFLALYCYSNPEWFKVEGKTIVQLLQQDNVDYSSIDPGWFAVSKCYTFGNELQLSFFESFVPVTTISNTIDIFHLNEDDINWLKSQSLIYSELRYNLSRKTELNREIKVAVYCHDEYTSNIRTITNILTVERGFQSSLITAKEIQNGNLSNFDVVLFPGGSGTATKELLGDNGIKNVEKFVKSAGGYVGICGGAYLASGGYGLEFVNVRASLEDVIENGKSVSMADRGMGLVGIKMNRIGSGLFNEVPKHSQVLFTGGPIFTSLIKQRCGALILASYESELCQYECQKGSMTNSPAIIANRVGNGLCVLISPHPEESESLTSIISDAVKMVSRRPL
jgi:glutamine amidotransferase-like uncharacterized protein